MLYRYDDPDFCNTISPEELKWPTRVMRDVHPGWDWGSIPLGDPTNPETGLVGFFRIAPGETLTRHAHDCVRVEVVLEGSMDVGDGTVLGRGDTTVFQPGEFYGPHTAGPDGVTTIEIFSRIKAMPRMIEEGATDENRADSERILATIAREQAAAKSSAVS